MSNSLTAISLPLHCSVLVDRIKPERGAACPSMPLWQRSNALCARKPHPRLVFLEGIFSSFFDDLTLFAISFLVILDLE
jgi:hypothetical protein